MPELSVHDPQHWSVASGAPGWIEKNLGLEGQKSRISGSTGLLVLLYYYVSTVIHDASLNFWVILSDVYHLLPARRPKGWWVHPSKSNSPPSWTRCPELRSTGVRPLGGNSALRNLEVKQMGGLLKKSCAKNGEPVVEGCRVESFSMETASEAASNPCHCGRGGWTSIYFTKWRSNWWMMTSQEAARAELEQSVVDDDGKAGTPKAAVIDTAASS